MLLQKWMQDKLAGCGGNVEMSPFDLKLSSLKRLFNQEVKNNEKGGYSA
jgi:hypothetical protein